MSEWNSSRPYGDPPSGSVFDTYENFCDAASFTAPGSPDA